MSRSYWIGTKGPTGKLQRIGLAGVLGIEGLKSTGADARPSYVPPSTAIERLLVDTWAEVLRVERVGIKDDFLELGGDSILAAQLIARVRDAIDVELTAAAFFDAGTILEQAAVVEELLLSDQARGLSDSG